MGNNGFIPVNLVRDNYNFSYDANSVSEAPVEIKKDGKTYKRLVFNNGVVADIPKQAKDSRAAIFSSAHKDVGGSTYTDTEASRIKGGLFKGTKDTDYFTLYGNEGSKVDVSGDDGKEDYVALKDAKKGGKYGPNDGMYTHDEDAVSKDNEVKMDKDDLVDLEGKKNYEDISGVAGTLTENSYPDNEPPKAANDKPDIANGKTQEVNVNKDSIASADTKKQKETNGG